MAAKTKKKAKKSNAASRKREAALTEQAQDAWRNEQNRLEADVHKARWALASLLSAVELMKRMESSMWTLVAQNDYSVPECLLAFLQTEDEHNGPHTPVDCMTQRLSKHIEAATLESAAALTRRNTWMDENEFPYSHKDLVK